MNGYHTKKKNLECLMTIGYLETILLLFIIKTKANTTDGIGDTDEELVLVLLNGGGYLLFLKKINFISLVLHFFIFNKIGKVTGAEEAARIGTKEMNQKRPGIAESNLFFGFCGEGRISISLVEKGWSEFNSYYIGLFGEFRRWVVEDTFDKRLAGGYTNIGARVVVLFMIKKKEIMFESIVVTEWFSTSFICCRLKRLPPNLNQRVPLENFTLGEVKKHYKLYYLDPGRTREFIAVSWFEVDILLVRWCSTTEYYTMTVFMTSLKKLNEHNSAKELKIQKKFKVQKDKVPLIVFGAAMFGKDHFTSDIIRKGKLKQKMSGYHQLKARIISHFANDANTKSLANLDFTRIKYIKFIFAYGIYIKR
ncbi:hypothetical protein K501DRAFT_268917 [Backusella circina FSU 941]|nr:hypothetical protein K501DRAFT_268917 [Backusella circina FSU 941]